MGMNRRIVVSEFVTLDGVMGEAGALLLGRKTYEATRTR